MRPLIWQPRSGERRDLHVDDLDGDVVPLDWSSDGDRLLLLQTSRARHRLWIYDVARDALHALDHPSGNYGWGAYFGPDGEIFATWEDATHPHASSPSIRRRARSAARCWLPARRRRAGHCAR